MHHRHTIQAPDPAIKSDFGDVQSVDAIKAGIAVSDQQIEHVRNLATEVHLVKNQVFGRSSRISWA